LPLKVKTELENAKKYFENTGKNLVEEVTKIELKEGRRIVFENAFFVAYIPYFTDYPYGVYIAPKTNIAHIGLFSDEECEALAETLKMVTGAFDFLFNKSFPYMMVTHQTPQHLEEFKEAHLYYGYHLEFYPPLRDADKIKWYASSEMGAWAAANVKDVDETAQEMCDALQKFIDSQK
jgi:UDPglucose--hexose-1-phosphate uridylyltransferase